MYAHCQTLNLEPQFGGLVIDEWRVIERLLNFFRSSAISKLFGPEKKPNSERAFSFLRLRFWTLFAFNLFAICLSFQSAATERRNQQQGLERLHGAPLRRLERTQVTKKRAMSLEVLERVKNVWLLFCLWSMGPGGMLKVREKGFNISTFLLFSLNSAWFWSIRFATTNVASARDYEYGTRGCLICSLQGKFVFKRLREYGIPQPEREKYALNALLIIHEFGRVLVKR